MGLEGKGVDGMTFSWWKVPLHHLTHRCNLHLPPAWNCIGVIRVANCKNKKAAKTRKLMRNVFSCFVFTGRSLTSQEMSFIKNFKWCFPFVFRNIVPNIILKFCPRKCFRYQIIDVETQPRLSDWVTDTPGELPLSISNNFQNLYNITLYTNQLTKY